MKTCYVRESRRRCETVRGISVAACVGLACMVFVSCGRKSKPEDLTLMNAGEQYGGVMGRAVKEAKKLDAVLPLQQLVDSYNAQEGKYPESLRKLVEEKYVRDLPQAPKGTEFTYDPSTGAVGVKNIAP